MAARRSKAKSKKPTRSKKTRARKPAAKAKGKPRKAARKATSAKKAASGAKRTKAGAKKPVARKAVSKKTRTPKRSKVKAKKISLKKKVGVKKPTPKKPTLRTGPLRPPKDHARLRRRPGRRAGPERKTALRIPAPRPIKPAAKPAAKSVEASATQLSAADDLNRLTDLVADAKRAGADSADAVLVRSAAMSQAVRLGEPEKLEREEAQDLGLRVFIGQRQAIVSATDHSPAALAELVARAVAMARAVPEDEFAGIAAPDQIARGWVTLDTVDPTEPDPSWLQDQALEAEDAARGVAGVTNSEGAEASWNRGRAALVASNGFAGTRARSTFSVGVSVLAGEGTAMERDYDHSTAIYRGDLEPAAIVGRRAGEMAVRRLNPRKVSTAKLPILFDPKIGKSLFNHLAGAINGASIARGVSFLKDKMGQRILPPGSAVIDDPLRPRGLASRAFDGEGIAGQRRALVEDGILKSWILDLRSARKLGLTTTGHAARGTSGPPSPSSTNLYLAPGKLSRAALIGGVESGLYVTETMGFGVNGTTGDFSQGAAGYWIERGELAFPVSEVTIAGNLLEMYLHLTAADDLTFRYGTNVPTLRIDGMTIAGK